MKHLLPAANVLGLRLALGASACRPGVVGPHGARPPSCQVW